MRDLFSCKVFQELIVLVRLMYFWLFGFCNSYGVVVLYFSHIYACGFVTDCQRGRLLESYFM